MSKLKFRKEALALDQLPEILQKGPTFLITRQLVER